MADPFDVLDLSPSFELDEAALAERHRELSLAFHPDRYAGQAASQRRAVLSRAMEVNSAYRALRDPVTRAAVLLDRLAVPHGEGREPQADPELLFSMMERREGLREATGARDRARLERLVTEVEAEQVKTTERLAALFREALSGGSVAAEALVRNLGELRYFRRFFDEAEAALDELD